MGHRLEVADRTAELDACPGVGGGPVDDGPTGTDQPGGAGQLDGGERGSVGGERCRGPHRHPRPRLAGEGIEGFERRRLHEASAPRRRQRRRTQRRPTTTPRSRRRRWTTRAVPPATAAARSARTRAPSTAPRNGPWHPAAPAARSPAIRSSESPPTSGAPTPSSPRAPSSVQRRGSPRRGRRRIARSWPSPTRRTRPAPARGSGFARPPPSPRRWAATRHVRAPRPSSARAMIDSITSLVPPAIVSMNDCRQRNVSGAARSSAAGPQMSSGGARDRLGEPRSEQLGPRRALDRRDDRRRARPR